MSATLYFYDLETSGFNPREARIMQFGGQRTDLNLKPVGEPHTYYVKLTEDVLPDPDAILVTGITPQKTLSEGLSEPEFLRLFHEQIATPDTVFVGFNSIRFDDEFMRYLHYRNFYDPYEWQWTEGKSRWDLLDLVRMTRALRPDGIKWPSDSSGKPTNRLELLTSVNKLEHTSAHDALSDVQASIALARLIRNKQPKLFDFLFTLRDKKRVSEMVYGGTPFLYTSGKYDSEWEKTTAVGVLAEHPTQQAALVFDLRYDPEEFAKLSVGQLAEAWRRRRDEPGPRLPVKTLKFNRCPAIAPLSVLDKASEERLQLSPLAISQNHEKLLKSSLAKNVLKALELLDKKQQARLLEDEADVDTRLYEDFFSNQDRTKMSMVRAAEASELADLSVAFADQRLQALLPLYKARHFSHTLNGEERAIWERFRERKLLLGKEDGRLGKYFARLGELNAQKGLTNEQRYILEELQLYGQTLMPVDDARAG
jgi:exodeoxyribonuclease-1